ncbi:MAG: 16S rRNA (cytidine(1402)-2'-O)-methyltransferase [Chloroflexota bacterium]
MGTLYIVATPIGNLEDITARALRVLGEARLIAAEDTRHTARLLGRYGITTPLVSYHAHNERAREELLLRELALGDVALVSDAGTPGISDPGAALAVAAARAGHRVSPVPGPSALAAAASVSGLAEGPLLFAGFLPRSGAERRVAIGRIAAAGCAAALFEAPGRLAATLRDLSSALGNREAVVCRELTKVHEEIRRGLLDDLAAWAEGGIKGEVVVIVGGPQGTRAGDASDLPALVAALRRSGRGASEAAREPARMTGLPRSEIYPLAREWTPPAG